MPHKFHLYLILIGIFFSGFTGPPKVEQIDLATVRVSWDGLVTQRECADQFLVKYWQRSNPQSYITTELLDRNAVTIDVKVQIPIRDS